jgi:hypothetical protein
MRAPALAVAFSLCACGPQDLAGLTAPDAPPVTELAHTVSVQFLDGAAHLTVKRTLRHDSQTHQSLTHRLLLPEGAAVTQLRGGPAGQFAEKAALSTAEEANARWDLLRSPGNATPATLGLLSWEWEWDGALQLQLFGLAPLALVDVQYELDSGVRGGRRLGAHQPERRRAAHHRLRGAGGLAGDQLPRRAARGRTLDHRRRADGRCRWARHARHRLQWLRWLDELRVGHGALVAQPRARAAGAAGPGGERV